MSPKTFEKIFCELTRKGLNFFGRPVTSGVKLAFEKKKNIIQTIKSIGGNVMVWVGFAASGSGLMETW